MRLSSLVFLSWEKRIQLVLSLNAQLIFFLQILYHFKFNYDFLEAFHCCFMNLCIGRRKLRSFSYGGDNCKQVMDTFKETQFSFYLLNENQNSLINVDISSVHSRFCFKTIHLNDLCTLRLLT